MQEYHVGYTGTRHGMSQPQKEFVSHALFALCTDPVFRNMSNSTFWFHHGDCVGGDDEATNMAREYGYKIYRHPPTESVHNRALQRFDATDLPYSYSGRNQRIAIRAQTMIAAPAPKSVGTWNAIKHVRALFKPLLIVHQNGLWQEERVTNRTMLDYLEEKHGRIGENK
jgi:hypothetical protein